MPKISRHDSFEVVNIFPSGASFSEDVWTDWGCRGAQDLKPGGCRGSHKLFLQERISERMCKQIGISEVPKISSQEQILQRTVEQILGEFGVPRVRGIAKSDDFIQKLDALFNQVAMFENVIDCRLREVKYDKEVAEKELVVALTRACALRFRK